ncbi:MAG: CHAT domain-containing protein [Candidatus Omnitrophota bacterium]|jgi:tetratricopeptide (TPR) repeat protein
MTNVTHILEVILTRNSLTVSFYESGSTVHHFDEVTLNKMMVERLCGEAVRLMNRGNEAGPLASGLVVELKKVGRALFDQLLSEGVKARMGEEDIQNLIILLDESLIQIPWEILHDGGEFLSLKYNMGRSVRTKHPALAAIPRIAELPLKMLVLADPVGDLPEARTEAFNIRQVLDREEDLFEVTTKIKHITTDYVVKNIRDYDVLHLAGHNEYNFEDPVKSGWTLDDGVLRAVDIIQMRGGAPLPLLVFANACKSANVLPPKMVISDTERAFCSIANAFLYTGVKHFLGTLMEIPDQVAAEFSREFYLQISNGKPVGAAVREARLRLLQPPGEDTVFWATYVLYGDPSSCLISRESPNTGLEQLATALIPGKRPAALYMFAGLLVLLALAMSENFFRKRFSRVTVPVETTAPGVPLAPTPEPRKTAIRRSITRDDIRAVLWPSISRVNQLIAFRNQEQVAEKAASEEQLEHFRFLVNTYASLRQYRLSTLYTTALVEWADARAAENKKVAAEYYAESADALLEEYLFSALFINPSGSTSESGWKDSPGFSLSLDLYQRGLRLTTEQDSEELLRIRARFLIGLARGYKIRGSLQPAIQNYELAVKILENIPVLSVSERYQLANSYVDLASLYVQNQKDFKKAHDSMVQLGERFAWDTYFSLEDRVLMRPVVRKFELLLRGLRQDGLATTQFYEDAVQVYKKLSLPSEKGS